MTRIGNDYVRTFYHGANRDVDASAEQLTSTSLDGKITRGVQLRASAANSTGIIYVGKDATVTAGSDGATDGFPLSAGEGLFLPIDDPSKLYVIGSTTNLIIYWLAY